MSQQSEPGGWKVFGGSVRGANHIRSGTRNQDAIGWHPYSGVGTQVALAVSDGHGSPLSFRSDIGAALAVDVSLSLARRLLDVGVPVAQLSQLKQRVALDLPRELVTEWRARVDDELANRPLSSGELHALEDLKGSEAVERVRNTPHLVYGATLLTVVVAASYMTYWQIGDGDMVAVTEKDRVVRPIPRPDGEIGDDTVSLCTDEAWRHCQVEFHTLVGTPPSAILVSSDGLSKSYASESDFLEFSSDMLHSVNTDGIEKVEDDLSPILKEISTQGSGDDITLGIAVRRSRSASPAMTSVARENKQDEAGGSAVGGATPLGRLFRRKTAE